MPGNGLRSVFCGRRFSVSFSTCGSPVPPTRKAGHQSAEESGLRPAARSPFLRLHLAFARMNDCKTNNIAKPLRNGGQNHRGGAFGCLLCFCSKGKERRGRNSGGKPAPAMLPHLIGRGAAAHLGRHTPHGATSSRLPQQPPLPCGKLWE